MKYLKTLNSSSAPEVLALNIESVNPSSPIIERGAVFTFDASGRPINSIAEGKPRYLALERWSDAKVPLKCMRIFEGMVFEAIPGSDPSSMHYGTVLSLTQGENNCYVYCGDGETADAEVLYVDPYNDSYIIVTLL